MIGRKPGATDITVEPFWPVIKLTYLAFISVIVGLLVAIGSVGLPYCWLCHPSLGSNLPGFTSGPDPVVGPKRVKGPGLRLGG